MEEVLKIDSKGQWSIEKNMIQGYGSDAAMPMQNLSDVTKDDKPHKAKSPEDSAHDAVEEDTNLKEEIKDHKGDKGKRVLDHLRTKKDDSWNRNKKNKSIGKD